MRLRKLRGLLLIFTFVGVSSVTITLFYIQPGDRCGASGKGEAFHLKKFVLTCPGNIVFKVQAPPPTEAGARVR